MDTSRLPIGDLLAERYEIVEIVGRGGMGTVYRALDRRLRTNVAIKEMRERPGPEAERLAALAQFEQEARMLASLRHPHLPAVTDYFIDADRWYLVMEFIEGSTLESILRERKGPAPVAEVINWGVAIADSLDYLHRQNPPIVFRDVKPANVMLRNDGTIKLIDFGIARRYNEGASSDTLLYGSPGYSPPEQYGHTQTDPRSDIYALGATLHHLITNRDPSTSPFRFPAARNVMPGIPDALDALLARCLELDPEDRPATAADVRNTLVLLRPTPVTSPQAASSADTSASRPEAVSATERPVASERPSETVQAAKPSAYTGVGSPRRTWLVATACVVVVLAMGTFLALQLHPAPQHVTTRPKPHPGPVIPPGPGPTPPTPTVASTSAKPMIRVISEEPSAIVFLDDQQVGETPWESADIPAGKHSLRIVPRPGAASSVPWQREIELRYGESLGVGPLDPSSDSGSAAGEASAELPPAFDLSYKDGFVLEGIVRLRHATGRSARVAAFFYDRDQSSPLKPKDPASPRCNKEDQLCVATEIRSDGSPTEVPVRLFVPSSDLPSVPDSAWCRVVVFMDDKAICRSTLYPVPIPDQ